MQRLEGLLIRDLRAIVALAERRHFAQAAEELGISQPSLSAIVKKVESALGTALFTRTSRRFGITPEGEAVVRQTRAVLEELTRLAASVDGEGAALVGRFRLGVIPTLAPYYIPHFLQPLCRLFPELELVFIEAKTEALLLQLRGRELDAALLALPVPDPSLESTPLFREPFVLAVPDGHRLAERESVTPGDVDVSELLILEQGNCLSDQTLNACGARRPEEVRPIHATSLETLRYMVATHIGTAVLPALAIPPVPNPALPVRYVPFAEPAPSRTIGLVSRRHSSRRRDALALAECLKERLPVQVRPLQAA